MISYISLFFLENIKQFILSFIIITFVYYFLFVRNKDKSRSSKTITKKLGQNKKILNPIFKNNIIITKESNCIPVLEEKKINYFEIYKLNKVKNILYIAFTVAFQKQIKIIKMNLIDKETAELQTIKCDNYAKKIKYFYDELEDKEYLLINCNNKIIIYLIQTESKFKKLLEYQQEGSAGGIVVSYQILPIYDFEIIINKFNNKIYLLVIFIYQSGCMSRSKSIKILELNKNQLISINNIKSDFIYDILPFFLIWEDNINKRLFLITNNYQNFKIMCKIIDIFNNESFYIQEDDKTVLFEQSQDEYGCIVQNKENDYLYLGDNEGSLKIINLRSKKIIKKISHKVNSIVFMENWNNKYIIIGDTTSIYVFDININQIISRYLSIFDTGIINNIKKIINEEYNFYLLCIAGDNNIIKLLY